jgi:hypothetical protein
MLINLLVFRRVARWWNQCQEGKENPIAAHTSLETPTRAGSFVEKDNGLELAPAQ